MPLASLCHSAGGRMVYRGLHPGPFRLSGTSGCRLAALAGGSSLAHLMVGSRPRSSRVAGVEWSSCPAELAPVPMFHYEVLPLTAVLVSCLSILHPSDLALSTIPLVRPGERNQHSPCQEGERPPTKSIDNATPIMEVEAGPLWNGRF